MLTNWPLSTRGATGTNTLKARQVVQVQELPHTLGSTLERDPTQEAQCVCLPKQTVFLACESLMPHAY